MISFMEPYLSTSSVIMTTASLIYSIVVARSQARLFSSFKVDIDLHNQSVVDGRNVFEILMATSSDIVVASESVHTDSKCLEVAVLLLCSKLDACVASSSPMLVGLATTPYELALRKIALKKGNLAKPVELGELAANLESYGGIWNELANDFKKD